MAHQHLNIPDVCPAFDECCCEAMPEKMRGNMLAEGRFRDVSDTEPDRHPAKRLSAAARENKQAVASGADLEIFLQRGNGRRTQWNDAIPAPFTRPDFGHASVQVEVLKFQRSQFAFAQP